MQACRNWTLGQTRRSNSFSITILFPITDSVLQTAYKGSPELNSKWADSSARLQTMIQRLTTLIKTEIINSIRIDCGLILASPCGVHDHRFRRHHNPRLHAPASVSSQMILSLFLHQYPGGQGAAASVSSASSAEGLQWKSEGHMSDSASRFFWHQYPGGQLLFSRGMALVTTAHRARRKANEYRWSISWRRIRWFYFWFWHFWGTSFRLMVAQGHRGENARRHGRVSYPVSLALPPQFLSPVAAVTFRPHLTAWDRHCDQLGALSTGDYPATRSHRIGTTYKITFPSLLG